MRIKNSVVVITGASSGIGRAAAHRFASAGAAVVLTARSEEALITVAGECEDRGAEALVVPADVSEAGALDRVARRADDRFGRIDVWVNNAAVSMFSPFLEAPIDDVRRVIDVNIMGYWLGCRAALRHMLPENHGVLVNVASIVGVVSQPYTHAYTLSKFAIRGLSASLRQELRITGARGIKVATVLPASIDTPLFDHSANYTGREVVAMPPVYTPERAARGIVNAVRVPRRETVVGPAGRNLVMASKVAPGLAERFMGFQVDRSHLSRERPARATDGTLREPERGAGSTHGRWNGRRRTATRRAASAGALIGVGAAITAARR
jgi:short-subunit dehydrogenase